MALQLYISKVRTVTKHSRYFSTNQSYFQLYILYQKTCQLRSIMDTIQYANQFPLYFCRVLVTHCSIHINLTLLWHIQCKRALF